MFVFLIALIVKERSNVKNKWDLCMTIVGDGECVLGIHECLIVRQRYTYLFIHVAMALLNTESLG
jgi:hypothetical protein